MKSIKPLLLVLICTLLFANAKADSGLKKDKKEHKKEHKKDHEQKQQKEGKKVPIDGGISLLVAAGAAFGAKKLFQKDQKNTPDA